MSIATIILPLFVEVLLTFGLFLRMAVLRNLDLKNGVVKPSDVSLREPNWPARTQQAAYSFSNQFELPVLFYVLTILEIITRRADFTFVILAWIFVISRLAHAYVHITSNILILRGAIYGIGALVLMAMWIIFIILIWSGLP
jgi:hypothetical protein